LFTGFVQYLDMVYKSVDFI